MTGTEARRRNAVRLAERLIYFADGAEEGGLTRYARKARVVANEALWLASELELVERACRSLIEQRDTLLGIVLKGPLGEMPSEEEPPAEEEKIDMAAAAVGSGPEGEGG